MSWYLGTTQPNHHRGPKERAETRSVVWRAGVPLGASHLQTGLTRSPEQALFPVENTFSSSQRRQKRLSLCLPAGLVCVCVCQGWGVPHKTPTFYRVPSSPQEICKCHDFCLEMPWQRVPLDKGGSSTLPRLNCSLWPLPGRPL